MVELFNLPGQSSDSIDTLFYAPQIMPTQTQSTASMAISDLPRIEAGSQIKGRYELPKMSQIPPHQDSSSVDEDMVCSAAAATCKAGSPLAEQIFWLAPAESKM